MIQELKNPHTPCKHWPSAFIADAKPVTAMSVNDRAIILIIFGAKIGNN